MFNMYRYDTISDMSNTKVASLIERLGNLLRSQERTAGSNSGLQSIHVQMLGYLSQCNRYSDTPVAVTEFVGATKGTTSQSINILEKKSFILKRPDKVDGRVIHLDLTDKGAHFVKNEFPPREFRDALNGLNSDDRESLAILLTKLLIQLQRKNNGKLFGVCHTCKHFKEFGLDDTHQCGLTLEPLSEEESFQICREHEQPSARAL